MGAQGAGAGKVATTLYGHGGQAVDDGKFMFVDKLVQGPMAVRREAFLNLGLFALLSCPEVACEMGHEQEVSLRAWLAGYQVSTLTDSSSGYPSELCSSLGALCPSSGYPSESNRCALHLGTRPNKIVVLFIW
eukprot:1196421-Prorocentrum_minimum.AAC.1